ncbi:hypothetical protein, partial [Alistipes finegoldii]|uniref:hypothetical protein n=1 Tax=Alistipes finegoldii TaxID=214856 RepID=UPI003AB1699C
AGTRKSCDDDQFPARNFQIDVLQVMHPRTFPPPLPVPSRSARLNPLLPVHSRSVIHPATPTEIIHRKSRKMRRFFCFFISSPYICPTNKIILFNTYPFITDRTN